VRSRNQVNARAFRSRVGPERPEGRPADQSVASRNFLSFSVVAISAARRTSCTTRFGFERRGTGWSVWICINAQTAPVQNTTFRQSLNFSLSCNYHTGSSSSPRCVEHGRLPQCVRLKDRVRSANPSYRIYYLTLMISYPRRWRFSNSPSAHIAIPPTLTRSLLLSRAISAFDCERERPLYGGQLFCGETCAASLAPDFVLSWPLKSAKAKPKAAETIRVSGLTQGALGLKRPSRLKFSLVLLFRAPVPFYAR